MNFVLFFAFALFAKLAVVETIRGGNDVTIAEQNYVVLLSFKWKFNGKQEHDIHCAGALVKLNAVMTTAKCSRQKDLTKILLYVAGLNYQGTPVSPTKVIINPDYDQSTLLNNLAIHIIPPQTASFNVGVCLLGVPGTPYNGQDGIQSGCGRTKIDEEEKPDLQTSTNKIIWNVDCNINVMQYPTPSTSPMPAKTQSRIEDLCTSYPPTNGGDTCLGDEGGPLVIVKGADRFCVGFLSFIAGTGNCLDTEPSVYVRTAVYKAWAFRVFDENK